MLRTKKVEICSGCEGEVVCTSVGVLEEFVTWLFMKSRIKSM